MKIYTVLVIVAVFLLTGCSRGSEGYRDGVYSAESPDFADSGWKNVVTATIQDGKISDVDWNAVNETGDTKKAQSRSGEYDMVAGGAHTQWHEQAAVMEQELIKDQDPAKIPVDSEGYADGISGVTIKVKEFTTLAEEALEQAK